MQPSTSKLKPALIGGTVIGILSNVPVVNMGNCFCCMWVLLGGGLAAYLLRRAMPAKSELTLGDGALTGLLSGVFGALIGALIQYFFMAAFGMNLEAFLENVRGRMEDVPPEFYEWMDRLMNSPFLVLIGLFFSMILYSIFGTLGGIFSAALFGKKKSGR
ncbi:MAG TPA: hypothetical protein VGB38_02445 [bacterium]